MYKKLSLLFALMISVVIFSACDETTTEPTTPEPTPVVITDLQATSIDAATVAIKFTASVSETNELFDGYYLTVTPGTTPVQAIPTTEINFFKVESLEDGVEYTFSIEARYTNDSVSAPVEIKWAPATRYLFNAYEDDIKVYEYSSNYGSGLDLYNADDEGPTTLTVAGGAEWNLGLNTKDGMIFGSASQLGFASVTPNVVTEICTNVIMVSDLDNVFDSEALNAKTFVEGTIDLSTYTESIVVICRAETAAGSGEYNYAKVLLDYTATGFLAGTTPNQYLTVKISYQKEIDLPYATVK